MCQTGRKHAPVFSPGILLIIFCSLSILYPPQVLARVSGQCFDCHTMHNSQDGTDMNSGGPYPNLLNGDCLGCHSSTTSATIVDGTPIVWNQTVPTAPLAGGNFYWIASSGNSELGHNVLDISPPDANLSMAPGGVSYGPTCRCHNSLADPGLVGWPGTTNGCTGCHVKPAHHADDSAGGVVDGSGGWYRFLTDHQGGNWSVMGIEDPDWEQTTSDTDHNEYLGGGTSPEHSMSRWCAGCHYNLHEINGTNYQAGQWFRHPVNTALPSGAGEEYDDYTAYPASGPISPVARPSLGSYTGASGTVTPGTDQVFCLSCHRAHGSPYPDMLRWDYTGIIAGSGESSDGCFACHTQKDTGGP